MREPSATFYNGRNVWYWYKELVHNHTIDTGIKSTVYPWAYPWSRCPSNCPALKAWEHRPPPHADR